MPPHQHHPMLRRAAATQKPTLLTIPTEIRCKIYSHLLPNVQPFPGRPLRDDGQKCSTKFMSTCRKIYGEAIDVLYGGNALFHVRISGYTIDVNTAKLQFLNQTIMLKEANTYLPGCLLALPHIKRLAVTISTDFDKRSACDVQDMTYKCLSTLINSVHNLEFLEVYLKVHVLGERVIRHANLRTWMQRGLADYHRTGPGQLSRFHFTAFLADPLRLLRHVASPHPGNVTMSFLSMGYEPWCHMADQIRDLVCSDIGPLPDLQAFSRYFQPLRELRDCMKRLSCAKRAKHAKGHVSFERLYQNLSTARIRGSVSGLHTHHGKVIKAILTESQHYCFQHFSPKTGADTLDDRFMRKPTYLPTQTTEETLREANYLIGELDAALPPKDLDTSAFGYNEYDQKLRALMMQGQAEAKGKRGSRNASDPQSEEDNGAQAAQPGSYKKAKLGENHWTER